MRQALNDNPMVQMAVLALCGVVLAFIVFTSVLKKDDSSAAATSTTADPAAATAAVDPAAATATPDPAAVAPATTPPAETGAVTPPAGTGEIEAGDGLPKDVLAAYEGGKAIALVVIDPKSEDSFKWVRATKDLNDDDVKVFVVEVDDIAKYSRITQGVSVSRTPALIVVTPRKLSGGVPMATVTYGFRSPQSAKQAINDAFYEGGNVPAYPSG
ncbi:MAG: hypothetical protein U0R24_13570 [Solirubrobacterales bacterium]